MSVVRLMLFVECKGGWEYYSYGFVVVGWIEVLLELLFVGWIYGLVVVAVGWGGRRVW